MFLIMTSSFMHCQKRFNIYTKQQYCTVNPTRFEKLNELGDIKILILN